MMQALNDNYFFRKGASMKKRLIPALLAVLLLVPVISLPAEATGTYGSVPVLTGYADVDYQAEQDRKSVV